jgi:hypothetical protein
MDRLRFLHIPKTAGSSFNTFLTVKYWANMHFAFKGDYKADIDCYMRLPPSERRKIVLFLGHAPISTGIEEVDDAKIKIITMLRNPISRVKSFVQHIFEGKSPEYLKYLDGPFDLDKFLNCGLPELSNLQTKMLINTGDSRSDSLIRTLSSSEAREMALDNLFNKICGFGFQEYFDESLILFGKALNWSTPLYISVNKQSTSHILEFKQHHADRIAELNSIDLEVYNAAKEKFLNKLQSPEFDAAKLEKLKFANSFASPYKYVWLTRLVLYELRLRAKHRLGI